VEALDHLAGGVQHAVRVLDERVALGREADPRPAAHEQRRFENFLELANALRDGGLRQVEIARRGVEAARGLTMRSNARAGRA
jgi:hypothetical protein